MFIATNVSADNEERLQAVEEYIENKQEVDLEPIYDALEELDASLSTYETNLPYQNGNLVLQAPLKIGTALITGVSSSTLLEEEEARY